MNKFMNGLQNATNYDYTENGGLKHVSTGSMVYDMFAHGAAMRSRSEADVITMFKNAFEEDEVYALKCLFYIRDAREGQGERRFFRACMRWLAKEHPEAVKRNIENFAFYGRWDDLYCLVDTPLEADVFAFFYKQLALDVQCQTPSLLAKWLKSENTSSAESRRLANRTRIAFKMSHKQYRKTLSILRQRINVLERLMSAGQWDKIEFDKIPSRAGLIYRNAFARHDVERQKADRSVQTYEEFAKDTTTKVNAGVLAPYECVAKAVEYSHIHDKRIYNRDYHRYMTIPENLEDTNRLMINKYWENLTDYFAGATLNGIVVADTSGSMTGSSASAPINVAISLALYCAERNKGVYAGHYISFASIPQLIKTEGADFVDKVRRIYDTNLVDITNLEAVFDLLLNTAFINRCSQDEIPETVVIISDMEIDEAQGWYGRSDNTNTMMENMRIKWAQYGYKMPKLVYWNVDARHNTILDNGPDVSYVSGMSPVIFQQILTGKTGMDLMYDKLDAPRYDRVK